MRANRWTRGATTMLAAHFTAAPAVAQTFKIDCNSYGYSAPEPVVHCQGMPSWFRSARAASPVADRAILQTVL